MSESTHSRVLRGSFWLYADNFGRLALNVGLSILIARHLGPEEFGVLNYATVIVALFLVVGSLGGDELAIVEMVRRPESAARVLGSILGLRCAASLVAAAAFAGVVWLVESDAAIARVLMAAGVVILTTAPACFHLPFQAKLNQRPVAVSRFGATFGVSLFRAGLLAAGAGTLAFAFSSALEGFGLSVLLWLFWRSSELRSDGVQWDAAVARDLLRRSLPVFLSVAAVVIYMKVNVVVLRHLASTTAAGVFSVAQKLSEVCYIVPVALAEAAFPVLVKATGSAEAGSRPVQLFCDAVVFAAYAVVAGALLLGGPAIRLLFGAAYDSSIGVFELHVWSSIPIALQVVRFRYLVSKGEQWRETPVALIGGALNVAFNLWWIPSYGAAGAAVATLVSYAFIGYLSSWLFPALRPIGRIQTRALFPFVRLWRELRARLRAEPFGGAA
jgi:O-antigen/teichoic acid export membrane protein